MTPWICTCHKTALWTDILIGITFITKRTTILRNILEGGGGAGTPNMDQCMYTGCLTPPPPPLGWLYRFYYSLYPHVCRITILIPHIRRNLVFFTLNFQDFDLLTPPPLLSKMFQSFWVPLYPWSTTPPPPPLGISLSWTIITVHSSTDSKGTSLTSVVSSNVSLFDHHTSPVL